MSSLGERTVRDLASRNPAAARIFEKFGIDYCCGGERSLAQACSAAKVSIREVADALEAPPPQREDRDWQKASLPELTRYIVEKHHGFVRQEIQRLIPLFAMVVRAHGQNHGELEQIQSSFQALAVGKSLISNGCIYMYLVMLHHTIMISSSDERNAPRGLRERMLSAQKCFCERIVD